MRTLRRPPLTTAVLAAGALLASSCGIFGGTSSTPGVTPTTVTIGSHQPLTGPAAPGLGKIGPAAAAYFEYINAHGGVNGRKIKFKYVDDGYDPSTTSAVVHRLVLEDEIFALLLGLGTPTHSAVVDFLNAQGVPDLFVASGCACWNNPGRRPWTFGWQIDYLRSGKILGYYIAQHYPGKKVAVFYQDDDYGHASLAGAASQISPTQLVKKQSYTPGNLDITAAVSAIAQSKADVVLLHTIPAYTAQFRLTAKKIGYNPQLVVSDVGSDPVTVGGLMRHLGQGGQADSRALDGVVTDIFMPPPGDTSNSLIKLVTAIKDKYGPKGPLDTYVLYGMMGACTFVDALRSAGPAPTRRSLLSAMESGVLNRNSVSLSPYAYGPNDRFGMTGAQIGIVRNGVVVPTGPVYVTTADLTGPITVHQPNRASAESPAPARHSPSAPAKDATHIPCASPS